MDPQTIAFYESQAQQISARYEAVSSPVESYFAMAFPPGARVLDVGCGSGRDAARLLDCGYDAYGIEPSIGLRKAALTAHPSLAGRIGPGTLPEIGESFGGDFDGVLCSAVLMHVPDTELLDAALALRQLLKPHGRLLLSLPASRGEALVADRDSNGRLFSPYTAEAIALLFERLGFQSIGRWQTSDHLGRADTSWYTLLLELRHVGVQRPIDQIEAVLNRDRKEATYKLALFRALATMAAQEARSAVWLANGDVGIESPRVLRRLQHLRRWSHEKVNKVFPRSTRTCSAHGARAPWRIREENERLRAEVAYLKKLQALIWSKRSAAPTKRV